MHDYDYQKDKLELIVFQKKENSEAHWKVELRLEKYILQKLVDHREIIDLIKPK